MKRSTKKAQPKRVTSTEKPVKQIRKIPEELTKIHFDDKDGWLAAYRGCRTHDDFLTIARAMIGAFRRRFFLSQTEAGRKLGVSAGTINKWENGLAEIRWKSKREMLASEWFKPFHFGLDADAAEFVTEA